MLPVAGLRRALEHGAAQAVDELSYVLIYTSGGGERQHIHLARPREMAGNHGAAQGAAEGLAPIAAHIAKVREVPLEDAEGAVGVSALREAQAVWARPARTLSWSVGHAHSSDGTRRAHMTSKHLDVLL